MGWWLSLARWASPLEYLNSSVTAAEWTDANANGRNILPHSFTQLLEIQSTFTIHQQKGSKFSIFSERVLIHPGDESQGIYEYDMKFGIC